MDKQFLEGLAGLLNQSAEDVAALFEGEGDAQKLKDGTDVLATVRSWIKTRTDDVYKAAQRKTAQSFESVIKGAGFQSDLQGPELLTAYLETVKEAGKGDGESDKKIAKLNEAVVNLQKALADKDAEIAKARAEGQRQIVGARLQTDLRRHLGTKWAGNEDQFRILASQFPIDRIRYEGDEPVLLNESGEVLVDELHRPVKFSDRVTALGQMIGGFHAVDPGKGSPPPSGGGNGSGGNVGAVTLRPGMDGLEFQQLLARETDPAKRTALIQARRAQTEKK